ncbi:homoserine O-acetyltransferase/O-succinyltransferase family protein [Methylocystis iwaonis]|uniref:homoserine O-acetyltransferase/O-succinyltransferase family protein n=1 Tax=Methylocystis iwaonis TaxID=2885079 RepID=UPI002E7BC3BA|nr:homoserine O-succinyltransferase [Methylocystis iwaonis]
MTLHALRARDALEIAFVNNMPDQALAATRAQFERLVRAGAEGREIRWRCYTLPGLERSETARRYLARDHEGIEALYRRGADALIVSGCEPRAARLDHEPYWPQLQTLADWARTHTFSTLWSCLAAHAATLHLAGIERRRMPKKISGVFTFRRLGEDWTGERAGGAILTPHSRYNALDAEALARHGFKIAAWSPDVGVDMFWREEPSLFVFLQGHPEYEAETLLKEYRRDVLRYLSRERVDYPDQPENYFSAETSERLTQLRACVLRRIEGQAEQALAEILSPEKCARPWADDAARLYRAWIRNVSDRIEALRHSA